MRGVWGVHIYFYAGRLKVDGHTFPIAHGSVSLTPPDVTLEWEFPDHAPHYYAHFVPDESASAREFLIMNGPIDRIDEASRDFEFIANSYAADPLPAEARLWDFLLRIALLRSNLSKQAIGPSPSRVQIAVSHISQNLSTRICVAKLAQQIDISHNYLTGLFQKCFGCTVVAFIRTKRCERASFLLSNTSLSIKSIAREVGVPDLNHFNKLIRRELGSSPSALRERGRQNRPADTGRRGLEASSSAGYPHAVRQDDEPKGDEFRTQTSSLSAKL